MQKTLCEDFLSNPNLPQQINIGLGTQFTNSKSLITAFGNDIHDKVFITTGIFTIDEDISFTDCYFNMEPCAKIVVDSRKWLAMYTTKLMCCSGRWEGIDATSDKATLIMQNCQLEDANRGIRLGNYSRQGVCAFTNNNFNRNRIGIQIEGKSGRARTFSFRRFYGNKFDCTSKLNAESQLCKDKNQYEWGFSGMLIKNIGVTNLGTTNINANVFTGAIRCGVEVVASESFKTESICIIQNCQFIDIECDYGELAIAGFYNAYIDISQGSLYNGELYWGQGYGINAVNSTINIKGLGVTQQITDFINNAKVLSSNISSKPTFQNCSSGIIHLIESNLSINNCNINYFDTDPAGWPSKSLNNVRHLIQGEYLKEENTIDVSGNYFDFLGKSSEADIFREAFAYFQKTYNTKILSNVFIKKHSTIGGRSSKMLIIKGKVGGKVTIVKENHFDSDIPTNSSDFIRDGVIFLDNTQGILCEKNQITGKFFVNGIFVDGSTHCEILENKIKGNSATDFIRNAGIKTRGLINSSTQGSKYINYCKNNINNANIGMQFESSCESSTLNANILENCKVRLQLPMGQGSFQALEPIIGLQAINPKDPNPRAYQNDFMNQSSLLINDAVHQGKRPEFSQFWVKEDKYTHFPVKQIVSSGKQWFIKNPNIEELDTCGVGGNDNLKLSDVEEAVIDNSFETFEATKWAYTQNIMQKLANNPNLLSSASIYQNFYNNNLELPYLPFANVAHKINQAYVAEESLLNEIDAYRTAINSSIESINTLINASQDVSLNETQQAELDILRDGIELNNTELSNRIALYDDAKKNKWLQVLNENETLNTPNAFFSDIKFINRMEAKVGLEQTLSDAEFNTLRAITNKCFEQIGGEIVRANNLLLNHLKFDFNSLNLCQTPPSSGKVKATSSLIYPNPSNDYVTVTITYPISRITISSMTGELLIDKPVLKEEASKIISTSDLSNGIYIISLWDSSKLLESNKLSILH